MATRAQRKAKRAAKREARGGSRVGNLIRKVTSLFTGKNQSANALNSSNQTGLNSPTLRNALNKQAAEKNAQKNDRERALGNVYVKDTGGSNGIIGSRGARVTSSDSRVTDLARISTRNRSTNKPSGISTALATILSKSSSPSSPADISTNQASFDLSGGGSGLTSRSSSGSTAGVSLGGSNSTMGLGGTANAKATQAGIETQNNNEIKTAEQIYEDYQKSLEEAKAKDRTWLQQLTEKQDNQPTREEIRADLSKQYGIQSQLAEINSLQDSLSQAEQAVANQVAAANDRLGSMNFINNQVAQIERNSAPMLNRLRADINFKTGILSQNMELIEQAIQDATADAREDWNRTIQLYNMNPDIFENVKGELKDAYLFKMKEKERIYKEQLDDRDFAADMAFKYGAGIGINDSREVVMAKLDRAGVTGVQGSGDSGGGSEGNNLNLTPAQQKTYEAYKSQISSYSSKEDALKDLEADKFRIIKAIGQAGYDALEKDIYNSDMRDEERSFWDKLFGRNK